MSSSRHLPPPPPPPPPMQQGNTKSAQNEGETIKTNTPPPPPPQQQQQQQPRNENHVIPPHHHHQQQQQRLAPPQEKLPHQQQQEEQRIAPPPQQRPPPPPQQQRHQHIPPPQQQHLPPQQQQQVSSFQRPRQPLVPPQQQQHQQHQQQQYARPPYQHQLQHQHQHHYRPPQQQQQLQPYCPPRQPVPKKSVPFWKRMADTLEDKLSKVDETIVATTQRAIRAVKPPPQRRVSPSSNPPQFNQHRPSQPPGSNNRSFENHLNNLLSSSYPIQTNDDDMETDYDEESGEEELMEDVNPFRGIMPTPGGHSPQSTTATATAPSPTTNNQQQTRNQYDDEDERWSRDVATHTRTATTQNNINNRSRNVLQPWIEELQQGKGHAQSCSKGRLAGFMDALPIITLLLVVSKSNDWWLEFLAVSILSHYTRQLLLLQQKPQTQSSSVQDMFISCFSSKIQNYQVLYEKYAQQLLQSCRKHFFTIFLLITAILQFLPTNYGMIPSNIAVPTNLDSVKDYFQNSFATQLQNLIPTMVNTCKQHQNFILQTPTFVLNISSWIVIFLTAILLPSSPSPKQPQSHITSKHYDNNRLMLQAIGTSSATRLSILIEPGQPIIHRQLGKYIQQQQSQVTNSKKTKKSIKTYIQQSLLFTPVLLFLILKGMQYAQQDDNEFNMSSILSNLKSLENWYDFNLGQIFNTWWKEIQREGNDWKLLGIWSYILCKTFTVLQQTCPSKPFVKKEQLTQLLQQLTSIASWQPPSLQQQSLSQIHIHDLWAAHSAKRYVYIHNIFLHDMYELL